MVPQSVLKTGKGKLWSIYPAFPIQTVLLGNQIAEDKFLLYST